jgi:hypothetical protein
MGGGIDYNLPSATLDDTVISNFGRKDTLRVTPIISTCILLWTATIIIVAAFVLHLSTTTSTTIEVGMEDVWTGLVEVFDMSRTNLLDERYIFKRKSGGAIVTYLRNYEYNVVYGSSKDAFRPIMPIHERVQFYLSIKREQSSSTGPSKVLTNHLNMGGMLTWSYASLTMVDFTYMSFIVLGATAWISTLQHLLSPSMDSGDDPMHAHGTQAFSTSMFHMTLS